MGLTANRQTVKKVTVNRKKWKILTVNRQLNQEKLAVKVLNIIYQGLLYGQIMVLISFDSPLCSY